MTENIFFSVSVPIRMFVSVGVYMHVRAKGQLLPPILSCVCVCLKYGGGQ